MRSITESSDHHCHRSCAPSLGSLGPLGSRQWRDRHIPLRRCHCLKAETLGWGSPFIRHPTHWAIGPIHHRPQKLGMAMARSPINPPNPATIFLHETWLWASRHLDLRSGCNPSTSFNRCQVRLAPPLKVQQSLSVNLLLSNVLGCRSTHISNMSKWRPVLHSLWEQLRFPVFPGPWPHAFREPTSCICAPLGLAVAGLEHSKSRWIWRFQAPGVQPAALQPLLFV